MLCVSDACLSGRPRISKRCPGFKERADGYMLSAISLARHLWFLREVQSNRKVFIRGRVPSSRRALRSWTAFWIPCRVYVPVYDLSPAGGDARRAKGRIASGLNYSVCIKNTRGERWYS